MTGWAGGGLRRLVHFALLSGYRPSQPGVLPPLLADRMRTQMLAAVKAEMAEAEAEMAELGETAVGVRRVGGSEGSGLGVHLRSASGDGRERGVRCRACLVETWNVCGLCDSCHSECRLAR